MIQFMLNDQVVETVDAPGRLLLDVIRERATGTKEGCREGDCGACSILLGSTGDAGAMTYEVVTSCLVPVGEVHGKHVVSIEGLNLEEGLNAVQLALMEYGGTQCGYCTPGFVVAMTGYLLSPACTSPSRDGLSRAISGCLCRCTGYSSILRAGDSLVEDLSTSDLKPIASASDKVQACVDAGVLPAYFATVDEQLKSIEAREVAAPNEAQVIVAGGTDLYVQRGDEVMADETVSLLNLYPRARGIHSDNGVARYGGLTTFSEFVGSPAMQHFAPRTDEWAVLLASLPIRNRATLAGNIVNASPIGDVTQILLGLGASLSLTKGEAQRVVPLEDFFLAYKTLDLQPGEFVTEVTFPEATPNTRFNFEKVSKRKALDISSVCGAARFEVVEGVIESARVCFGGVAPIPLLCRETSAVLEGKAPSVESLTAALDALNDEIAPISDVRGSADYKRRLARHLLIAHFSEAMGAELSPAEIGGLL
jgi:xanthine dehydrogenase small subunit